jgi:glycosidase
LRRYRGRLDGVLDFPLAQALRSTFATGRWTVGDLESFLEAYERYMAEGPARVSFLDNHDMNRFLFVAGGDARRLKLAALCQFALGPPCLPSTMAPRLA